MSGKLGGNIHVTGNFQRTGSRMEGSYSYNLYMDDSLVHLSHIIILYGNIDEHNEVVFKQFQTNDTTVDGLFYGQRFSGSWYGPDSTVLPFSLTERYPGGSIPMRIFYLHSDKKLVPKAQGTPSAKIELTLLYPESSPLITDAVNDSVRRSIQIQFFGQFKPDKFPTYLLDESEKNFYERFSELNSHWKTNRKLGFNLEKKEQVTVIFNSYNLLCLQYKKRGYAGRGNPLEHISYDMIDLRNGEKLTINNIFQPNAISSISNLINNKIRQNHGLSDSASLKKIGFFYDSIPVSKNMEFSGNGIYFVYNIYDLALPEKGIQKIFLPFSEIGTFIKPSCVLYPLSR